MGHGAEDRGGGGASNPWLPPSIIPPLKKKTHTRGSEEGELSMPGAPAPRPAQRRPSTDLPPQPARQGCRVRGQEPNQLGLRRPVPKGVPSMRLGESSPWHVRVGATLLGVQPPYADPCPQSPAGRLLGPSPGQVLSLPPGPLHPPKCASVFPSGDGRKGLGDPSSSQSEAPAGQSWAALISLLSLVTHLSTEWWLGQPRTPTPTPPAAPVLPTPVWPGLTGSWGGWGGLNPVTWGGALP